MMKSWSVLQVYKLLIFLFSLQLSSSFACDYNYFFEKVSEFEGVSDPLECFGAKASKSTDRSFCKCIKKGKKVFSDKKLDNELKRNLEEDRIAFQKYGDVLLSSFMEISRMLGVVKLQEQLNKNETGLDSILKESFTCSLDKIANPDTCGKDGASNFKKIFGSNGIKSLSELKKEIRSNFKGKLKTTNSCVPIEKLKRFEANLDLDRLNFTIESSEYELIGSLSMLLNSSLSKEQSMSDFNIFSKKGEFSSTGFEKLISTLNSTCENKIKQINESICGSGVNPKVSDWKEMKSYGIVDPQNNEDKYDAFLSSYNYCQLPKKEKKKKNEFFKEAKKGIQYFTRNEILEKNDALVEEFANNENVCKKLCTPESVKEETKAYPSTGCTFRNLDIAYKENGCSEGDEDPSPICQVIALERKVNEQDIIIAKNDELERKTKHTGKDKVKGYNPAEPRKSYIEQVFLGDLTQEKEDIKESLTALAEKGGPLPKAEVKTKPIADKSSGRSSKRNKTKRVPDERFAAQNELAQFQNEMIEKINQLRLSSGQDALPTTEDTELSLARSTDEIGSEVGSLNQEISELKKKMLMDQQRELERLANKLKQEKQNKKQRLASQAAGRSPSFVGSIEPADIDSYSVNSLASNPSSYIDNSDFSGNTGNFGESSGPTDMNTSYDVMKRTPANNPDSFKGGGSRGVASVSASGTSSGSPVVTVDQAVDGVSVKPEDLQNAESEKVLFVDRGKTIDLKELTKGKNIPVGTPLKIVEKGTNAFVRLRVQNNAYVPVLEGERPDEKVVSLVQRIKASSFFNPEFGKGVETLNNLIQAIAAP